MAAKLKKKPASKAKVKAKAKAKAKPAKAARKTTRAKPVLAAKAAPKKVSAIPEGTHTITPHLVVKDGAQAIDFYQKAFGAQETYRMTGPGGQGVMHAELRIGYSALYLGEESPMSECKSPATVGGTTFTVHLYVEDADALYNQAVAAGAKPTMPLEDAFWGDRYGKVMDPFGHSWSIATHKEDVPFEEMEKRLAAMFAQPQGEPPPAEAAAPPQNGTPPVM